MSLKITQEILGFMLKVIDQATLKSLKGKMIYNN